MDRDSKTSLVVPDVPAPFHIRRSESSLLHERDQLQGQVDDLERRLEEALRKRRHFVEYTCDRCRTSISVTASMAISELAMMDALASLFRSARWRISSVGRTTAHHCPACAAVT